MIKLPGLKWISFVLCLLCIAGASFAFATQKTHASSAATLANPGFEGPYTAATPAAGSQQNISGQIANGWTDDTAWTSDTIVYAQDTTTFHCGQSSQRVDIQSIPAGQAWQFRQTLPLQANQLYTASIWLRGTAGLTVQLRLQLANAPYTSLAEGQVQLSDQWTQVTAVGVVPTTSVLFQIRSVQTGTLWMDDAQLTSTPAPPLTPPTSAIPRSYFGMETKNLPPTTPWPAVNFGTLRLWDSGVPWNALEPSRGVYDFTLLNNWVNAAQQHHAEIILTLAVTPQWASSRPNEPSVYGPGGAAPPANMQDWIDFVTKVATTFKGKIHYYEVWNEPDLPIFYTGTIDQLVSLSSTAYTALKGVDSSIKVISPPFSSSTGWLDNFLAKGGGNSSDIIGFHFYATDNPEYMPIQITNVRLVMQRYHLKQPLWDTEAASGTSQTPPIQGAGMVARTYLLNWAAGAQRYVWYAWDNHVDYPGDAPMTQGDNTTITREATAYQEVENWLVGSRMLSLTTDAQNTWTIALLQPDGSKSWIVWNPDKAVTLSLPDEWHIHWMQDLYGDSLNLQGNEHIQVAGSPVLLATFPADHPTPPRPPAATGINPLASTTAASTDLYGGGDCQVAPFFGGNVGQIGQGSWIKYSHVTLSKGLASFTANLQTFTGVTAHLQVLVDAKPQAGCGLTDGGQLVGGQQIADLTVTPSSAQNFNGPYVNETAPVAANYPTGKHDLYLLATGEIGNLGSIQFSSGSLPAGWTHQDLGHPQSAGTAGYANGIFTLSGAGKSQLDLDHASQFAYQGWSGNGQIIAHVASQDSHGGAAGVMLRNGVQSNAPSVALVLVPGHGAQLISRASASAQPVVTTGPALNVPAWLKLTRQGTTITGFTSSDGANWTTVATATVALNPSIDAGLVAASNDRVTLSTATFDTVAVGPISNLPGTWTDQDLGTATTPGTASYSNGIYSVSSSGADIWNTSDAFHYAYTTLTGDGQIVARVVSQSATPGSISEWSKAGVMLRSSLDPASPHALVEITPQHGTQMVTRAGLGASSNAVYGPFVQAPYWLKLVRQGDTFTSYTSGDGQNWSELSSATIQMGATVYAGLVVTAFNTTQVATATFDHVAVGPIA